jgi:hypothetical protein
MGKTLLKIIGTGLIIAAISGCERPNAYRAADANDSKTNEANTAPPTNQHVISHYGDNGLIPGYETGFNYSTSDAVTAADVNNDGKLEIIVVGRNHHVYVYENNFPQAEKPYTDKLKAEKE